jgi:adenosylcobinamide kinase / adenosylcobinamide-phosphate guanylyltransferase
MGRITYITGPVRSGKSRFAVELSAPAGAGVVFVATYRNSGDDLEMQERVRRHRAERPAWRTLENARDVAGELRRLQPPPSAVLMDCLTLWLADRLDRDDEAILAEWRGQLEQFRNATWPIVIVGNEVGWSLVPEQPVLRRFRDLAGTLSQLTAAAAEDAWLLVAGCPVRLKGRA